MTYINDSVQSHHRKIDIGVSKGYQFLIFSKAINSRVIKIPAYNGGVLNRHWPRAVGYLNSGFTCQQIRYLKSLNSQTWLDFHYDLND